MVIFLPLPDKRLETIATLLPNTDVNSHAVLTPKTKQKDETKKTKSSEEKYFFPGYIWINIVDFYDANYLKRIKLCQFFVKTVFRLFLPFCFIFSLILSRHFHRTSVLLTLQHSK